MGEYFFAFEGRRTLDDNMCNRFHFGRDILFTKVEVHFTFLGFFGQDGRDGTELTQTDSNKEKSAVRIYRVLSTS